MLISIMQTYEELISEITKEIQRLRVEYGTSPCPENCFSCCKNTATMAISEIEARDLTRGLEALPLQLRIHIRQKAERTIQLLESQGYTLENMKPQVSMDAVAVVKGKPEGECPMLIGGVCAVYEHRPVICRIWGYPLHNGNELACCPKTFIGKRKRFKPLNYTRYWAQCQTLSKELGQKQKEPNCYVVARLLSSFGNARKESNG